MNLLQTTGNHVRGRKLTEVDFTGFFEAAADTATVVQRASSATTKIIENQKQHFKRLGVSTGGGKGHTMIMKTSVDSNASVSTTSSLQSLPVLEVSVDVCFVFLKLSHLSRFTFSVLLFVLLLRSL